MLTRRTRFCFTFSRGHSGSVAARYCRHEALQLPPPGLIGHSDGQHSVGERYCLLCARPIFVPQASGHASRGASVPSRHTLSRKIFRNVVAGMLHDLNSDCRTGCARDRSSPSAWRSGNCAQHEGQRFFLAVQRAFQLRVLDRRQNLPKLRARLVAQMQSGHRPFSSAGGRISSAGVCSRRSRTKSYIAKLAVTAQAIDAMQLHVLVELRQPHEALQRRLLHLRRHRRSACDWPPAQ